MAIIDKVKTMTTNAHKFYAGPGAPGAIHGFHRANTPHRHKPRLDSVVRAEGHFAEWIGIMTMPVALALVAGLGVIICLATHWN